MATKTVTQKVKTLTLDSNFKVLDEFICEPELYSNFEYLAKFEYNSHNKIEKIKIFNINNDLICEISRKDIENTNTNLLSKQNSKNLIEKIKNGDNSSIKKLFLYNCFFC